MNTENYNGIVFFDLDGTLLDATSHINQSTQNAIQQLKDANYLPAIATGRSYFEIKDKINSVGIDTLVGLNGAIGILNGRLIFHENISKNAEKKLKRAANQLNHVWAGYNEETRYCNGYSDLLKKCYEYINEPIPEINLNKLNEMTKQMILLMTDSDDDWYRKQVPELSFYRNSPYAIDIVAKNMNKAKGIKRLLKHLNMSIKDTYAFGDGRNDYEMFELIHKSVAMDNAIEDLKEIAYYVTGHHNQDGILEGLKYLELI